MQHSRGVLAHDVAQEKLANNDAKLPWALGVVSVGGSGR
jgi:hypothetical protein